MKTSHVQNINRGIEEMKCKAYVLYGEGKRGEEGRGTGYKVEIEEGGAGKRKDEEGEWG